MKKTGLFSLFIAILLSSCGETAHNQQHQSGQNIHGLQLLTDNNPEWQYENLRLVPITAEAALVGANQSVQQYKTLAEAMTQSKFRITELKQFGREMEAQVNALTVQNKSQDTVFILTGDVITGGNQDRVIAADYVIPPASVQQLSVYCVEQNRWQYYDQNAGAEEQKVAAFKGYYNVASPRVRNTIHRSGSQQDVWKAVAHITTANNAGSSTATYAALEQENDMKAKRDAYLRFFEGKFAESDDIVGMMAVCGDQILSVDIFAHPDLFRRQFSSLLHGYVSEAVAAQPVASVTEEQIQRAFGTVARMAGPEAKDFDKAGKFVRNGRWLHLYSK